jgi:hypothetical protein
MIKKSALAAFLLLAGGSTSLRAQDVVLNEIYGRGVHRYFANDYQAAIDQLSLAIDNGSKDPRAYYFRGLANAASGNFGGADADWQLGATTESQGAFNGLIGQSLVRIQGPARLRIEQFRTRARLDAATTAAALDDTRYGTGSRAKGVAPPTDRPMSAVAPDLTPAMPPITDSDPFTDDPLSGAGDAVVETEDSFGGALDSATPSPIDAPPAGASEAVPGDSGFGDPAPGDSPFGNPAGGDDIPNPFG